MNFTRKTTLKFTIHWSRQDKKGFLNRHRTQKKRFSFSRTRNNHDSDTSHAEKVLSFQG
ncbi:hypothetical protein KQI21_07260 [Virgibacillus proomii]|nr:hypothetical protein [Virgibacillus proomii]